MKKCVFLLMAIFLSCHADDGGCRCDWQGLYHGPDKLYKLYIEDTRITIRAGDHTDIYDYTTPDCNTAMMTGGYTFKIIRENPIKIIFRSNAPYCNSVDIPFVLR